MISEKIKALLTLSGKQQIDLANYYSISRQSMNNKLRMDRISARDLIRIAEFTGSQLYYELPNGQKIKFDYSDARSQQTEDQYQDNN